MRDDADMDRRDAVKTMFGLGALPLVGACARTALTRTGQAQPALTPRQLAGQRVIFSYPGLTVPAAPAAADQGGPGRRGDLLRREHLGRGPDRVGDPAAAPGPAAQPGGGTAAADDGPGGRAGPSAARGAGAVGEADRRGRAPGRGGQLGRHQRGPEPGGRGHERQPGAGARRLPRARRLHRSVPALLQQPRGDRDRLRDGFHHRPAAGRRGRHGQALPRPGAGHAGAEHRCRPGHPRRVPVRPAGQGRGALPGRHRRRGQARDGVLGDLPGAGRRAARPGCRRR